MNRIKYLVFVLAIAPSLALAQSGLAASGSQAQTGGVRRTVGGPAAGIDLSSLNPAQRTLHTVMVRVQQAGILGDEVSPTSRRIVLGMNYVMRISLTPDQQALIDPQVWRTKYELPREWDRVKNSGSAVSALAKLSKAQEAAISKIYAGCGVNWDPFGKAAGPNPSPARRVSVMVNQQEGYLRAVRAELNQAQRTEWDKLVALFAAEMKAAVNQAP